MTTVRDFFRSLDLDWDRLHIISADTTHTAGVHSEWTQDLEPAGDRTVLAGELVELHVTLDKDHPVADARQVRFDILEFDWLLWGCFDDPVASLKGTNGPLPDADFRHRRYRRGGSNLADAAHLARGRG